MNQSIANEIFKSDLGQTLDVIYVTCDDSVFETMSEAILHVKGELVPNSSPLEDSTIMSYYPRLDEEWIWQYLEKENLYYLCYFDDEGLLGEWFFENKKELDEYILENQIAITSFKN